MTWKLKYIYNTLTFACEYVLESKDSMYADLE